MRILVNDIAASKTGALSILKDFYDYIRTHETEHEWIFLLSDRYLEETDNIRVVLCPEVKKGWLHRLWFDLISGKKVIRGFAPDVLFSLQNTLPLGYKGRQVLYVHQPLGFQKTKRFSFFRRNEREYAVYQHLIGKMINASVKRADVIIVQTEWMKDAVLEQTHVAKDKVKKILPIMPDLGAYRKDVHPSATEFFYPSGNMRYKNHEVLYQSASILHGKGIRDFRIRITLTKEQLLENLTEHDAQILHYFDCMGPLERHEVLSMYQKSTLVFPSYIETYGYPPAEASAIGTLVLASDCPFCREVLGSYVNGYYFDPFDAAGLADLLSDIISGRIVCKPVPAGEVQAEESPGWAAVCGLILQTSDKH